MISNIYQPLPLQDDSATRQFAVAARLNKDAAKDLVLQPNDPAKSSAQRRDKLRQEAQQTAREQRYRVVNCLRTTLNDEEHTAEESASSGDATASSSGNSSMQSRQITIVDIESQQQEASGQQQNQEQQQPADSDIGYVYDLYVPENEMEAAYVDLVDDNYLRFVLHIEQMFNSITNVYM